MIFLLEGCIGWELGILIPIWWSNRFPTTQRIVTIRNADNMEAKGTCSYLHSIIVVEFPLQVSIQNYSIQVGSQGSGTFDVVITDIVG